MVIVKKFCIAALAVYVIVLGFGAPAYAAAEVTESICDEIKNGTYSFTNGQLAAVIMIVIGGIMYTTSAGDDKRVIQGKKIILGSLIGLAIAILAYVIVNFAIKVL
jgi:hypothetical protein